MTVYIKICKRSLCKSEFETTRANKEYCHWMCQNADNAKKYRAKKAKMGSAAQDKE